jgi:hypothetical protein
MRALFTKLSDEKHALEIVRDDGTRERGELESRSFLVHDLAHFVVEKEAHLAGGFWGLLANGTTFGALTPEALKTNPAGEELMHAESLAAPFQTLWGARDTSRFEERRASYASQTSAQFCEACLERMRRVWGQWRATKYGDTMELTW